MRILRIADVPDNRTAGMSRVMYATGDALERSGHQVEYLFADGLWEVPTPQLRRFVVPCRLPGLVRRRQRGGPAYDIVEIHEPLAAAYCLARRLDPRLPPAVVISYGVESRGRRAMLEYRRRKCLPVSLKARYSPLLVIWQGLYALRHCAAVICFNAEDAAFVRAAGVSPRCVVQTHSGVGEQFLEAGARAAADRPRSGILFMGTWIERKGILDLTQAAARVLRKYPGQRLTVAGCGLAVGQVLQGFAPELRDRVAVIPRVDGDAALVDIYRRHAIYVLPSYFEGQALSMLEAAALGLAIVTTDVCGKCDFVRHGENGLLVRPGNPEGLAGSLERLVKDEGEAARLGEAARQTVREFTWDHAALQMLAAYRTAASAAGGPPRKARDKLIHSSQSG